MLGRRFFLKCEILTLGVLAFLGVTVRAYAVDTRLDFYTGTAHDASWTWQFDGATYSGIYDWECGYIIAGELLRSHAGGNFDLTPLKAYTGTMSGSSDICDASVVVSGPGCYDLYISGGTNGFVNRNYQYPPWRNGYYMGMGPDTKTLSFQMMKGSGRE